MILKETFRNEEAHTVAVFSIVDGNECVKSHQGLMRTAPDGAGKPVSRIIYLSKNNIGV